MRTKIGMTLMAVAVILVIIGGCALDSARFEIPAGMCVGGMLIGAFGGILLAGGDR